jgi:hypothetical protein
VSIVDTSNGTCEHHRYPTTGYVSIMATINELCEHHRYQQRDMWAS